MSITVRHENESEGKENLNTWPNPFVHFLDFGSSLSDFVVNYTVVRTLILYCSGYGPIEGEESNNGLKILSRCFKCSSSRHHIKQGVHSKLHHRKPVSYITEKSYCIDFY